MVHLPLVSANILVCQAPNKKAGAAVSQVADNCDDNAVHACLGVLREVQSAGMDLGFFNFTGFETTKAHDAFDMR